MVMNLASEAGRVRFRDLFDGHARIGETVKTEADFAKGALADGTLESVVADYFEFGGSELLSKLLIRRGKSGLLVDGGAPTMTTVGVSAASAGLTHDGHPVCARRRSEVGLGE